MNGPGDTEASPGNDGGLSSYVIPEFHPQGEVSLEDDVGATSIIPGELPPVVRIDIARNNRGGRRKAAEAVESQPSGDERLHTGSGPEIADVIKGCEVIAIVREQRLQPYRLKCELGGAVRITPFQSVMPCKAQTSAHKKPPRFRERAGHSND